MVLKERIINCFNSGSYQYDTKADIQPQVATRLAQRLEGLSAHSVLEIGCGTGFLSRHLQQVFPAASLLLTDISPAMLEKCGKNISDSKTVELRCIDGESLKLSSGFDLIVSSMSLHWFNQYMLSIAKILEKLNSGGRFEFAMLGESSLHEWRELFLKHELSCPTPTFPNVNNIQENFPDFSLQIEVIQQHYNCGYDFLKTLKNIGANAAQKNHVPLSPGRLRSIMREFDNKQNKTISYEIIYGSYIKK